MYGDGGSLLDGLRLGRISRSRRSRDIGFVEDGVDCFSTLSTLSCFKCYDILKRSKQASAIRRARNSYSHIQGTIGDVTATHM
jgi:hypothetical protein